MEEVRNWLRGLGLEQYAHKFEEDGWDSLGILQHMRSSDIEACINKPGHRRKFEIGIETDFPKNKGKGDDGNKRVEECTIDITEIEGNIVTTIDHTSSTEEMRKDETQQIINKQDELEKLKDYKPDAVDERNNETDPSRTVIEQSADESIAKGDGRSLVRVDTPYEILDATEMDIDLSKQENVDQTSSTDQTYHGVKSHRLDNEDLVYDGTIDTVCVTGARNKILMPALPTDSSSLARSIEGQYKGNKSQTVVKGFLAVKDQIPKFVEAILLLILLMYIKRIRECTNIIKLT